MSAFIDVKVSAVGRWASILTNLGIDEQYFSGKHGPCPFCRGKDRYRWDKNNEYGMCSGCGHKSGMDMAMEWLSMSFRESADEIKKIIGTCKVTEIKKTDDTAKNQARIDKIKAGLKSITSDCAAGKYLAGRGITVFPEKDCYFNPSIAYYDNDGKKLGDYPAMVSIFRNIEGKGSTFHLTYLTDDGKKANVPSQKKILPVVLPMTGCAIQLFKTDTVICIAEGIETALAVNMETGAPVWAAGNAANMAAMVIPDSITDVIIYADYDKSFTGQKSAYALANRLSIQGKNVGVIVLLGQGDQKIDRGQGGDFLDFYLAEQNEEKKYRLETMTQVSQIL